MKLLYIIILSFVLISGSFSEDANDYFNQPYSKCTICLLGKMYNDPYVTSFLTYYGERYNAFEYPEETDKISIVSDFISLHIELDDEKKVDRLEFQLHSPDLEGGIEQVKEILESWDVNSNFKQSKKKIEKSYNGYTEKRGKHYKSILTNKKDVIYKLEMYWYKKKLNSVIVTLNYRGAADEDEHVICSPCEESSPWAGIWTEEEIVYEEEPSESGDEEEYEYSDIVPAEAEAEEEPMEEEPAEELNWTTDNKENKTAVAETPGSSKTAMDWFNLGVNAASNEDMVTYFTKVIDLDPKISAAYSNRGVAHLNMGNNAKAIEDFTKMIELNDQEPLGYYNRGCAYAAVKENAKAASDLKTYVWLNGNAGGDEQEIRDYIRFLEGEPVDMRPEDKINQDQKDWFLLGYYVRHLFKWQPNISGKSREELRNLDLNPFREKIIFIETILNRLKVTGEAIEQFNKLKNKVDETIAIKGKSDDAYTDRVFSAFYIGADIALLRSELKSYVKTLEIDWKVSLKFKRLREMGDVMSEFQEFLVEGYDANDIKACDRACNQQKLFAAVEFCRKAQCYDNLTYFLVKTAEKFYKKEADADVNEYITSNVERLVNGKDIITFPY